MQPERIVAVWCERCQHYSRSLAGGQGCVGCALRRAGDNLKLKCVDDLYERVVYGGLRVTVDA